MRQIILDTETTGLDPKTGHRIIEIGCVEMRNRRLTGENYHQYINPQREVDPEAEAVHGISNEFLADKPLFADIFAEFFDFIKGAELIIHNAAFDIGFINHEMLLLGKRFGEITQYCDVIDTLLMARKLHPGQKNNLDALCKRYSIDNSRRDLHGALLDSEILAQVYLAMTSGQDSLFVDSSLASSEQIIESVAHLQNAINTPVITANRDELAAHEAIMSKLNKVEGGSVWKKLASHQE